MLSTYQYCQSAFKLFINVEQEHKKSVLFKYWVSDFFDRYFPSLTVRFPDQDQPGEVSAAQAD